MITDYKCAAYQQGVDDGYACKRDGHIPSADIVAAWGQAYAEAESYHPNVHDFVRWNYLCGFTEGTQKGV